MKWHPRWHPPSTPTFTFIHHHHLLHPRSSLHPHHHHHHLLPQPTFLFAKFRAPQFPQQRFKLRFNNHHTQILQKNPENKIAKTKDMTGGLQTSLSIRLPKHSEEEEFIITNNNTNSMQSPQAQALRNGGNNRSPSAPRFHSTVAEHKLRHFNSLILVFCLTSFSFSLASSVFMLTNSRGSDSPHWHHYDTFRFVVAANAIVAVYSVFEMGASVWEISRGATLFPEVLQVWFDFGHDQVFAYLLLSASAAGTSMARTLRDDMDTCTASSAFCVQADIAIALAYAAFLFLGFTSLLSGFRLVCFMINGSRFHL